MQVQVARTVARRRCAGASARKRRAASGRPRGELAAWRDRWTAAGRDHRARPVLPEHPTAARRPRLRPDGVGPGRRGGAQPAQTGRCPSSAAPSCTCPGYANRPASTRTPSGCFRTRRHGQSPGRTAAQGHHRPLRRYPPATLFSAAASSAEELAFTATGAEVSQGRPCPSAPGPSRSSTPSVRCRAVCPAASRASSATGPMSAGIEGGRRCAG